MNKAQWRGDESPRLTYACGPVLSPTSSLQASDLRQFCRDKTKWLVKNKAVVRLK
jgi:hypothetical protein